MSAPSPKTFAERLDEAARSARRLGSFGCPTCGRFSRVIAQSQDLTGEWWFQVDCKRCGAGVTG